VALYFVLPRVLQAVQLLVVCGADLHVANAYGHTPLGLSRKGSAVRQCLLQLQEGGPEERQRLNAALKLGHQQSMAARDNAALAAQAE
jgi:hypothetical protein